MKKTLLQKLGIKENYKIFVKNEHETYFKLLGELPLNVILLKKLESNVDFIHLFVKEILELEYEFTILKNSLSKNGCLWVSWIKSASKLGTDLNENIVREIGLKNGLVDVKVCSIDDIWSGLKFVFRLKNR